MSLVAMEVDGLVVDNLEWIYQTARTFCRSDFDAEDLAQDTILKLLICKNYDGGRRFRDWVYIVMRNTHYNKVTRKNVVTYTDMLLDYGGKTDPMKDMITGESLIAIESMCERYGSVRALFMLSCGYSVREIAAEENISENAVLRRINHGRKMVFRALNVSKC